MKTRYLVAIGLIALCAAYVLKIYYLWPWPTYAVIEAAPVYAANYDSLRRPSQPIGYLKPGDKCRVTDIGDKGLPELKVSCSTIEGWGANPMAFDPPLQP